MGKNKAGMSKRRSWGMAGVAIMAVALIATGAILISSLVSWVDCPLCSTAGTVLIFVGASIASGLLLAAGERLKDRAMRDAYIRDQRRLSNLRPQEPSSRGRFPTWAIVVAICFFPLGLLALLARRKPTMR
jgi:hypothetical protein